MTRVTKLSLSAVAGDVNGFTVSDTDVTGPFPINIPIDGALSSTNVWSGNTEVDLSANSMGVLVGFTLGTTGSAAIVTITGRDVNGNALIETVTMPGASAAVSSLNCFSFIESMSIDGA